ncbi:MAG: translocation/assembly module TamB domain-containing protein [Muribaculaceae bacterium]|nr:translocation/assembly module TamB domain-containing protein [Muribaculaceae bacterium]
MKKTLRVLRALAVSALSLVAVVPVALYIMLSTTWAQTRLCAAAESELTSLLGTPVEVGEVRIHPFNRLDVRDIRVADDAGRACLSVERLGVRFELYHFIRTGRIVFDYALVDRPTLRLSRATASAPLNVEGILSRLKGDGDNSGARFRFKVATLALRDGSVSYDVEDAPPAQEGRFDASHVEVTGLQLHACLRLISNEAIDIELDRMSLCERSGFELRSLAGVVLRDASGVRVQGVNISLRNSTLAFDGDFSPESRSWHVSTDTTVASMLYLPDMAPFIPATAECYLGLDMHLDAHGDSATAMLERLSLSARDESFSVESEGGAINVGAENEQLWLSRLDVRADMPRLCAHLERISSRRNAALRRAAAAGHVRVHAYGSLSARSEAELSVDAHTAAGSVHAAATAVSPDSFASARMNLKAELKDVEAGLISGQKRLGGINAAISASGHLGRKGFEGVAEISDADIIFNGRRCGGIVGRGVVKNGYAALDLDIDDRAVQVNLSAEAEYASRMRSLTVEGDVSRLDLNWLGVTDAYEGYTLDAVIDVALNGSGVDDVAGRVELSDIDFRGPEGRGVSMNKLLLTRDVATRPAVVELQSDYINGRVTGDFVPSVLRSECVGAAMEVFPAFAQAGHPATDTGCANDFDFEFTIADAEELSRFFNLPVQIIHPIEISGAVACAERAMRVEVDAPYLQQADKIIDNTAVYASLDGTEGVATVYCTTHMPTKKGPMAAVLNVRAADNVVGTVADWTIERKIPLNGTLSFSTALHPGADGRVAADVDFHPGTINFGDDVWTIRPSRVSWSDGVAEVRDFALTAGDQRIAVDGTVSAADEPCLHVDIDRVSLLPIFETLEIDKALLSGTATGVFEGRRLLGADPVLTSERLHVDGIGYNRCTLGDADIRASWNNAAKAVELDADLTGPDGRHSSITGSITPAREELDITFLADRVRVGFMQPFMSAFASRVDGYASGRARLFGTFKYIDLEGDIYADSLALKVDFTNTEYFCSDSVRIRPGVINVDNATIRDINGHTARLDGVVRHVFFKQPSFDFTVSDARDFLSYNVGSKQSPDWYGTIYGNGGAHIYGEPGVVNIDVNMATAAGSTFTFVLSDMMEADDYSFITFRDRTPVEIRDSIVELEQIPAAVLEYQKRMAAQAEDTPSDYNMDFRVDITPAARMILVMDPVGGDEIKAYGSGNIRLTYGSANNDLRMFGTYTLDRGSYNFTLQDIIIKDFTIDEGSSISFHGDPYAAQLDIEAVYAVNANLSDLDESFLQDRDLNRTNVPVHALMKVTGDMRQPDIAFDLRFPTLSSDVYRKVRSIVSTEEMMNRQIIYLLALNRFYTPDYMSTTKGNELFSVASSTISSQLSSMLGKLSDNWTIAPNLRSDRGDFSDVEVDVALSSRLLNNRLLFNGNFGYRDKSLNTNQFVGDFDIEYLLNRRGIWRLKAYNRYNDQNYYLRTAATTQGVGIMFKRDFDSLLSWLKPFRRKKTEEKQPADSIVPQPADSVPVAQPLGDDWLEIK